MIYEIVRDQWKSSAVVDTVVKVENRVGHAISRAAGRSVILGFIEPLFAHFNMFGELRENSAVVSVCAALFKWLLAAVSAVYNAFDHIWLFRWIARLIDAVLKLKLCEIYAVMAALILCVYHDFWNNGYMLIAALIAAALYLFKLVRQPRNRDARLPVTFYLMLIAVAAVVPMGLSVSAGLKIFSYYLTSFIFMICFAGSVRSLDDLRRVLLILYVAVLFNSFFALIQNYYGVAVNISYTDVANNPESSGRVYATFYNPNNFAEILLLMTPGSFVALLYTKRLTGWAKGVAVISFALPIIALLLTLSRSSWISFAIFACSFAALYNLALIPVMIVLFIIAIPFVPYSIKNRFLSLFTGNDSSMEYRLNIWDGALKALRHDPLTGYGLGSDNFFDAYRKFMNGKASVAMHAHNLYLEFWLETGICGIVSFVLAYLSTLKNTLLIALRERREFKFYAVALFSTLFGLIFVEMVEYIWYYPRVMLCFWIIIGLSWALIRMVIKNGSKAVKNS